GTEKLAALHKANQALRKERQTAYYNGIIAANFALSDNNVALAEQLLADCPTEHRGWEWHYLQRQCRAEWVTLAREGPQALCTALNGDCSLVAVGHYDGTVSVWDVAARKLRYRIAGGDNSIGSVVFSPDGALLVSCATSRRFPRVDHLTIHHSSTG